MGKTTLARELAAKLPKGLVYLNLERPSDVAKLQEPELYLELHLDVDGILMGLGSGA